MRIKAFIAGCAGHRLTVEEARFFRQHEPWGFILFARNIDSPSQVSALTDELRDCTGRGDTPILIDQEGGRVQRLRPPHWPAYAPARDIGAIFRADRERGERAAWLQSRLIAFDLARLGINVDCLPVLDVPCEGAHDIIGDRAYGRHPQDVAFLGRRACEGLIAGGILPVVKHIPGHGRARADSHHDLPRVDTYPAVLGLTDFYPFMQLADMPIAMTAHVVYTGIDPERPATTSPRVVGQVIREWIGFDGLLVTDDVSMRALSGDFGERAKSAFEAGCDIVLHCNGDMEEMAAVAAATPRLVGFSQQRAERALELIQRSQEASGDDEPALRGEYEDLMNTAAPAAQAGA